jgi:Transaldolase/Fructose-6-phosphate aldolase
MAPNLNLKRLHEAGVSIWLDTLSRQVLQSGEFAELIRHYSDVLYVSELIGSGVVNTMPDHTLRAFADHGEVAPTLEADPQAAERTLSDATAAGIDLDGVTAELEREGVRSFCDSYRQLLDCIEGKLAVVDAPGS